MKRNLIIAAVLLCLGPIPQSADQTPQMCLCKFVAPVYSPLARTVHWQDTVLVNVAYDSTGTPQRIDFLEPGPPLGTHGWFNDAITTAVQNWRFCPPSTKSERTEITVTFKFGLKKGSLIDTDEWSPTEVSFEPPATVNVTTTARWIKTQ